MHCATYGLQWPPISDDPDRDQHSEPTLDRPERNIFLVDKITRGAVRLLLLLIVSDQLGLVRAPVFTGGGGGGGGT